MTQVFLGWRDCAQIEDGEIYASINQKDGMVCFHDNPEKYNNPAMLHKIDQEVSKSGFSVLMSIYKPLIKHIWTWKLEITLHMEFSFPLQMLKCIELDEKLKSMDQEITVNPQFVQKVRQHVRAKCVNGIFFVVLFGLMDCCLFWIIVTNHVRARNTLNNVAE